MTCLRVPEVGAKVVTLLSELDGDYLMHYLLRLQDMSLK